LIKAIDKLQEQHCLRDMVRTMMNLRMMMH